MSDITALLPHLKLRFNIEHPSLEECYIYGYECALADIHEEDNPYDLSSKESEQWLEGWWAGFYGDKPLFNMAELPINEDLESIHAANDYFYRDGKVAFFIKLMEVTGLLAVSAIVGYQLLDLVA